MADQLPSPPVSPDIDLKDFPFTPIYRARLFGSAFHAKADDAEWRAGVTLWLKSQDQKPAGSLPDDDVELCRLAELGRDLRTWHKLRPGALHGWYKCSDGRLYNDVVAEIVNEQWQSKLDQRSRTLKGRIANLEKRLSQTKDSETRSGIERQLAELRQALSQKTERSVTEPATRQKRSVTGTVTTPVAEVVTEPVTEAKRSKEKEREGNLLSPPSPPSPITTPEPPEVSQEDIRNVRIRVWQQEGRSPDWIETRLASTISEGLRQSIAWLKLMPVDEIIEAIDRAFQEAEDRGKPIDRTWAYLDAVVQNTAKRRKDGKPAEGVAHPDPLVATWRGRLAGWQRTGFWPDFWGKPLGHPDCEVPPDVLREFQQQQGSAAP